MPNREKPTVFVRAAPNADQGEALRLDLAVRLRSFTFDDEETRASKVELTLDNYDTTVYDDPAFKKGMHLEVAWGYPGNMAPTQRMVVTAISGGPVVTVKAESLGILMNTETRTRQFTNMRRSDAVREIARLNGWEGDLVDIEETPVVYPAIQQARLTDAQFIRRLAMREGFLFYVDATGFHFHRRRVGTAPVRVLEWFTDLSGTILNYNVTNDITARPRPGSTRVRGRNALEGEEIDEEATDENDSGRDALSSVREVIDPETGASRIETAMAGSETIPTSVGDSATARREAVGRFRNHQQMAVKMSLELIGDPTILPREIVEVRGLGRRLSQRYYIKRAKTTINESGYSLAVEVVSDGAGGHSVESRIASGLELYDPPPTTAARVNEEPPVPGAETGEPAEGAELVAREEIDPETGRARVRYSPG